METTSDPTFDVDDPLDTGALVKEMYSTSEWSELKPLLDQISRRSLLTAEQEVELAKAIEVGLAAENVLATRRPEGRRAVLELEFLAAEGRKAKDTMIHSNLRLVIHIAKQYRWRGLDLVDLIQEGVFGLDRAIGKFDYMLGFKFSTYATNWIRQSMARAICDQGRTIRIPVHMHEHLNALAAAERALADLDGTAASDAVLADRISRPVEDIKRYRVMREVPLSLDLYIADSAGGFEALGELLVDPDGGEDQLLEHVNNGELRSALDEIVTTELSERQAYVLRCRAGMTTGTPMTLAEIGNRLGVTRERVRQLEGLAVKALRESPSANRLLSFFDAPTDVVAPAPKAAHDRAYKPTPKKKPQTATPVGTADLNWERKLGLLQRFAVREGHVVVRLSHREDGVNLGTWLINQRTKLSNGTLTEERIAKLDNVDAGWRIGIRETRGQSAVMAGAA